MLIKFYIEFEDQLKCDELLIKYKQLQETNPYVVKIFKQGKLTIDELVVCYFEMEQGQDLSEYKLKDSDGDSQQLIYNTNYILELFKQIIEGIKILNFEQNYYHGDIKIENLILVEDPASKATKIQLIDLDFAFKKQELGKNTPLMFYFTLTYLPIELFEFLLYKNYFQDNLKPQNNESFIILLNKIYQFSQTFLEDAYALGFTLQIILYQNLEKIDTQDNRVQLVYTIIILLLNPKYRLTTFDAFILIEAIINKKTIDQQQLKGLFMTSQVIKPKFENGIYIFPVQSQQKEGSQPYFTQLYQDLINCINNKQEIIQKIDLQNFQFQRDMIFNLKYSLQVLSNQLSYFVQYEFKQNNSLDDIYLEFEVFDFQSYQKSSKFILYTHPLENFNFDFSFILNFDQNENTYILYLLPPPIFIQSQEKIDKNNIEQNNVDIKLKDFINSQQWRKIINQEESEVITNPTFNDQEQQNERNTYSGSQRVQTLHKSSIKRLNRILINQNKIQLNYKLKDNPFKHNFNRILNIREQRPSREMRNNFYKAEVFGKKVGYKNLFQTHKKIKKDAQIFI